MGSVKQDMVHAINVTKVTLKELKHLKPRITQVQLKFDNAPWYHGTLLWLFGSKFKKSTSIAVTQLGINAPGEGKDETNNSFTTAKSYVRRSVAYGLDSVTALDFIKFIKSAKMLLLDSWQKQLLFLGTLFSR